MKAALAIVTAILALNLANGFVLAQTVDEWFGSIKMFNAQTGWATSAKDRFGPGSVVRTTDGGLHWKDVTPHIPPEFGPYFEVHWLASLNAWMRTSGGSDSALFHTVNGGQTWKSATIPWKSVPVSPGWSGFWWLIDFINARDGWLVSGKDVHRSTDGGKTWVKVGSAEFPCRTQSSAKSPIQSIAFLNATTGWITGYCDARDALYHLVTRDGGHTWQPQELPLPPKLTRAAGVLDISQPNNPRGPEFLTAQDGILPIVYGTNQNAGVFFYVTRDGGTSWTYTTPVTLTSYPGGCCLQPDYRSSSFADVNHGWVTDGDPLYLTNDGGRQWTKIQPSLPFDRAPLAQLAFISPQVGWAIASARGTVSTFLLKTLDGGRTWSPVTYTISRQ
jgi:photosystem II stability/assembly factor-like uncharacterized protein